jgi:predicted amidophosphoribosyltransferase
LLNNRYTATQLFFLERPQPTSIQIPVQVLKPSSSSDNQNLTIYEQRRALRDLCVLCDQPFNDWQSVRICPTCDYKIRYPSVYDDIRSRPNTRSRSTNIYLPTSDRDYTASLSPVPKTRPLSKIICPHCKNPNLLHNLTRNTEFRCSACQNPISSVDRY